MKNLAVAFGLLSSLVFSSAANADGYFRAGAMYLSSGSGNGSISSSSSRTLIDAGGGWIHSSALTIGGLYAMETQRNTAGTETNRTSYGPTVGYMPPGNDGAYLLGTYFLQSTYGSYKGTGYQIDLGYRFPAKSMAVAIQMSYKRFSYNDLSGAQVDPPYLNEYIDPYFVIVVPL